MPKTTKEHPVKGIFAFWRYGLFPYVLGAEATRMDEDGKVYVPNYRGWVTPIKLLPLKKGKDLLDALKGNPHGLEHQRLAALEVFEEDWDARVFVLLPEASDPACQRHVRMKEKKKNG